MFAYATELLSKREPQPGAQAIAAALFATGTLGALALAFTFALDKGWLTIALALMSLGTAWISLQRPVPLLRWLAAILAAIVIAAHRLRAAHRRRRGRHHADLQLAAVRLRHPGAVVLGGQLLPLRKRRRRCAAAHGRSRRHPVHRAAGFMEIRHLANGGDVYRQRCRPGRSGATGLRRCWPWAIGLERLHMRTGSVIHNAGAILLTAFAGLAAVFGLLVLENPMLWHIDVGGAVINLLLLGYALPAVLALLLSYAVAGRRPVAYANTIAAGALILALAYVTFEIRRIVSRPGLVRRTDHRRRAIHLFDRVARIRRGAARHRHSRSTRSARVWRPPRSLP